MAPPTFLCDGIENRNMTQHLLRLLPVSSTVSVLQLLHQRIRVHIKVVLVVCVRGIVLIVLVFIVLKPQKRNDGVKTRVTG